MKCILIGTGDMAHALARQYTMTPKDAMLHSLCIGSPTRKFIPDSYFHGTGIPFVDLAVGLEEAHVVLLAIPGKAMTYFIAKHHETLKDKLIFNINNHQSTQETDTFDSYELRWVQGLSDIGAVDLLSRKNKKTKPKTRISGKDVHAVLEAKSFVETAFGMDVTAVEHQKRERTEQDSIGKEWKHAACIAIGLYLCFLAVITVYYYKRLPLPYEGHKWPVRVQNKIVSCTAVACFALTVMPGTMARLIKTWNNDSLYMLPPTLLWALGIRKHMGLMGLFFLFVHAISSLLQFSPGAYYWWAYNNVDAKEMNLTGEVSMMFAIYATAFYAIIGLSSLPSVCEAMNKAQWGFIFGPLCWTALAFGHVHYCVIYFRVVQGTIDHTGGIPHPTLLGSLLPWLAFFLKFVQLCVSHGLPLIRSNKRPAEPRTTRMRGYCQHLQAKDTPEMCSN